MVEERELLAHQRPVDVVLALDDLEQAAELGAPGAGHEGRVGVHQRLEQRHRDRPAGNAEPCAGTLEQRDALVLEHLAVLELDLEDAGQLHHTADVLVADRGALLEHHLEQPPGGDQLSFEVSDHLGGQGGVGPGLKLGRRHHCAPTVLSLALDASPCGVPIDGSIACAS